MSNITRLLLSENIDNITYETAYVEYPIPDILQSFDWKYILKRPPVTDTHDTASYPSGHTVYSKLVANILQNLFPQISSAELDSIVHKTGVARVKQGVHYPSDNEASIIFSNHLFKILQPKLRN